MTASIRRLDGLAAQKLRIIGIDPGETTGIAVLHVYDGEVVVADALHHDSMQAPHWLHRMLGLNFTGTTEVVIERFTISQRTLQGTRSGPMETLYTIGALRYVCDQYGLAPFFQTPSQAKSAYSDETLRDLDLWPRTSGPHERDALRHALLHARTRGLWNGKVSVPV